MSTNDKTKDSGSTLLDGLDTLRNSPIGSLLIDNAETLKAFDNSEVGKTILESLIKYVISADKLYHKQVAKASGGARTALQEIIIECKGERKTLQETRNSIKEDRKQAKKGATGKANPVKEESE